MTARQANIKPYAHLMHSCNVFQATEQPKIMKCVQGPLSSACGTYTTVISGIQTLPFWAKALRTFKIFPRRAAAKGLGLVPTLEATQGQI